MLWRKEGCNIAWREGKGFTKRCYLGKKGQQEHSKQRKYQVQKLWSGNITVMFQEDTEVIVAKAEVRKRNFLGGWDNKMSLEWVMKGLRCCCKNFAFYSQSESHWRRFKSVSWLHTTLMWVAVADVLRKVKRKNRAESWEAGLKVVEVA